MWGLRSKKALEASEAEVTRLDEEVALLTRKLADAATEHDDLMERLFKERHRHRESEENIPRRGGELAREALDLLQHSPLFPSTDIDAPAYTRD